MASCVKCGEKIPVAVDLGLSVKWAECDVGASSPFESGRYFGWADPTGNKVSTDLNDYPSATPPWEISRTKYDMARVNWGGNWRLPTEKECQELVDKCDWKWTGNGMEVTGPNGESIFLPAAGFRDGARVAGFGTYGGYWSSTLYEHSTDYAYSLVFCIGYRRMNYDDRNNGLSVRPVVK
jgi:hypothetical protein